MDCGRQDHGTFWKLESLRKPFLPRLLKWRLTRRLPSLNSPTELPLPILHLELWVSSRKDRARLRKATQAAYRPARRITRNGGGRGPWVFLVDADPADSKTAPLRNILGVRTDEDLWAEFAFYPNRTSMRSIIKRIWNDKRFRTDAARLERLVSKRMPRYPGTIAYAALQPI